MEITPEQLESLIDAYHELKYYPMGEIRTKEQAMVYAAQMIGPVLRKLSGISEESGQDV